MQNVIPIRLIKPEWRICGLVTAKEHKRFTDGRKKIFFDFEVIDEEGGRIEIVAFDENLERLFPIVDEGKMYYISGGKVGKFDEKFNNTGHDFQIIMEKDSEILPCNDRQIIVEPPREYDVVPLASVGNVPHVDRCVDVIAIVESFEDLVEVGKGGPDAPLYKRDVELKDMSGMVVMTLWMEHARNWDTDLLHQVVGIKGACHNEFKGKHRLSSKYSTRIEKNPNHENAKALHDRFLEH